MTYIWVCLINSSVPWIPLIQSNIYTKKNSTDDMRCLSPIHCLLMPLGSCGPVTNSILKLFRTVSFLEKLPVRQRKGSWAEHAPFEFSDQTMWQHLSQLPNLEQLYGCCIYPYFTPLTSDKAAEDGKHRSTFFFLSKRPLRISFQLKMSLWIAIFHSFFHRKITNQ